jgi:hypothetical protein
LVALDLPKMLARCFDPGVRALPRLPNNGRRPNFGADPLRELQDKCHVAESPLGRGTNDSASGGIALTPRAGEGRSHVRLRSWVRERSSNRRRRADSRKHLDGGAFCRLNADRESSCLFQVECDPPLRIAARPCNSYIFRETVQYAALFLPQLSIVRPANAEHQALESAALRPVRRLQNIVRWAIRPVRSTQCNAAIS